MQASVAGPLVRTDDRCDVWGTGDPFAREAASSQLFTALHSDDRPGPALIASDARRRLLVLEDLGHSGTVFGVLMHGQQAGPRAAGLGTGAQQAVRVHINREAEFTRRALPADNQQRTPLTGAPAPITAGQRAEAGVDTPTSPPVAG